VAALNDAQTAAIAETEAVDLNHIHLRIQDLNAAVAWFETIMQVRPGFRNERMATFSFNSLTLILDQATDDVSATVGFESKDCDRDFQAVMERGAVALEPPTNKDWGVRTAYFKGPGELKFEIEGPIANL
jgi:catechol 2,3-dioxygenase-like lactoylglutathione lyase family enzyme